ncbi:hypothetical protein [Deinococcus sp. 23YEL01]|uniref:hypothetical protein n=1 Tax=Deinococcus sp. 23YEL01 TaxID=2745871 RepID=UPI001E3552B6|nr:hypothetical protein [Deinococcus sp. 23YEL01]MCD0170912.1 hypothetical protein [Deinococcus sp. 23YEL01]
MNLRSWLTLATLTVLPMSLATPATVASQITQQLGGIAQACPPEYVEATCVRLQGGVVKVAGQVLGAFPTLLPEPWRDGPQGGLSTEVEANTATLHLVPRGEDQTLLILHSRTASLSPASATPATTTPEPFSIENPEDNYFVILSGDQPVKDPSTLPAGTYSMIVSGSGKATQRTTLTVPGSGWTRLMIPRLSTAPARVDRAALQLPDVPGYVFIVYTASGQPVLDLGDLLPGYYDVRSFWQGEAGPVAFLQELKPGQATRAQFTGTFSRGKASTPAPVVPIVPTVTPAPAAPGTSGMCWVNGYRRSNGTYVNGYYRRC